MEQKIRLPPRPLTNDLKVFCASKAVPPQAESKILPEKPLAEILVKKQPALFLNDFMREDAFCTCQQWFKINYLERRPLLLIGPCGSGKTALINYFSNGILDFFMEDLEDEFLSSHCFRAKIPAVFDAIESLDPTTRSKLKKSLSWKSRRPLIFTSDDAFAEPTKTWAKSCTVVNLERPSKSFITQVLKALQPDIEQTKLQEIVDMCNGNLSTAKNALFWTTTKTMFTESPLDVPKTTRLLLCGYRVSCIGDAPYLLHQLQNNTLPVAVTENTPILKLARTLENYSFLDLQECRHAMDTESIWSSMELVVKNGPQLKQASKFRFEWPKSLKPLENFIMPYN